MVISEKKKQKTKVNMLITNGYTLIFRKTPLSLLLESCLWKNDEQYI